MPIVEPDRFPWRTTLVSLLNLTPKRTSAQLRKSQLMHHTLLYHRTIIPGAELKREKSPVISCLLKGLLLQEP